MATRATWELDCDQVWCDKAYQADFRATISKPAIRRAARADGWHAPPVGKTYCPDHKPEPKGA